jgi:1,2-diacylglycerol 3-beta-glucosyltransferase
MVILTIFLAVFGVYVTAYALYELVLLVANAVIADPPEFEPETTRRFNIIVPAHDEELLLPRLLASLQSQQYPTRCYRVTVIADNCTDATTAACAPYDVDVFERVDAERRGKGYAIQWVLQRLDLDAFDAIVILDGDSRVNPEFLKQLNLQLERGDRVIQTSNAVANPEASWFTRLMDISETMANEIVHPGKVKLGLSVHLLGNGMCFDTRVIKLQEWNAFSVGEDWEYYAKLALKGIFVGYCRLARQYHEESTNLEQASSQRIRWSGGRFQVLRQFGPGMLARALRTRSIKAFDACLPLAFPNPSLAMNLTGIGLLAAGLYWLATGNPIITIWFATLVLLQLLIFIIAIGHTRNPMANAASLLLAPVFLVWKLAIDVVSFFGVGTKEWKRTARRLS